MKALLTEREAAEVLGISERSVRRRAEELGAVRAPAENGRVRRLYDLASLPAEAALEWAQRPRRQVIETSVDSGQLALALTVPQGPNLSAEDREQAERRYRVIEPLVVPERFQGLWAQCGGRKGELIALLAREHKTKPRTIYHWLTAWKTGGLPALVKKDRSDKGRPRALNAAALDFLLAAALPRAGSYGALTVAEIYRAYNEERAWRAAHAGRMLGEFEMRKYARYTRDGRLTPEAQLPAASYETFRAWFDRIPEVVRTMARDGVEAFANTQEIISFRDLGEIQPLDYVVMDHRRLDLFCLIPDRGGWKLARPWLTAAIDMRTRKWLGWAIVETPSSDSIACVLKKVFLEHGVPRALYWDNGKDFTCQWFEGRREQSRRVEKVGELAPAWRGVLDSLGVRVHHAIVRRARAKIIEPNFIRTAEYDRSTPWFCGHRPTARPERFEQLMDQHEAWLDGAQVAPAFPTIAQVAALYDELMYTLNERELRGEGMAKVTPRGRGWMCPNEAWELLIPRVERRFVTPEVLQFAFAKRRTVTVRNGSIQVTFDGQRYHYRPVDNSLGLMAWNGREVEWAYDPMDLGIAAVYCEGRLLGLVQNVELRRMGERYFVEDEKRRRAARREVKRAIKAVHRTTYVPGVVERAARRAEVRPERIEPARVEAPAAVASPVLAAAAAMAEDRAAGFEPDENLVVRTRPARATNDDEFDFFGGTDHAESIAG